MNKFLLLLLLGLPLGVFAQSSTDIDLSDIPELDSDVIVMGACDHCGKNITLQSLMTNPLPDARFSSSYGWRMHPVFQEMRLHTGVDYAAPAGTPVTAIQAAKVVYLANRGGYGKTVVLKHDNTYSTLYAHLERYAPGLVLGSYVKKGDLIGFVGSTGNSTGPHLHYEIRKNGQPVDPSSGKVIPLPTVVKVKGPGISIKQKNARIRTILK
ncbi:M23 family metallopeptidase [Advenella alkanexedens]|uniref:M23 family metallopeptidase n=1 Tax=Advenella alkanexedens TaxID=1481665 RepID=A0ABS6NNU1_9BURK|nr:MULTISPECIES: M23 family metallopeptidase [Advenella]MBV4397278.1 M23 family metallopeptidase [Advenella alkanexedens]MDD3757799.1 M23 family metallopeptidase [Advenella sp.]NLN67231.1 M23 family metallopeptidase [Alcaligenaceae bacterium]